MARREAGRLRESGILVVERDAERRQVRHVILSLLSDGRWQLHAMELPRGGWSATEHFQNEEDARALLDAFYSKHAAGMWEVSRWGPKPASRAVNRVGSQNDPTAAAALSALVAPALGVRGGCRNRLQVTPAVALGFEERSAPARGIGQLFGAATAEHYGAPLPDWIARLPDWIAR